MMDDLSSSFEAHPHVVKALKGLQGGNLFITGGTGFFGHWLLESLGWIRQELKIEFSVTVLTRSPEDFQKKSPHLAEMPFLKLCKGDIRTFEFPKEKFSHLIHAATETNAKANAENPILVLETISKGTQRALEFAVQSGVKRFLLTSSGAVYGRQPSSLSHISEDYEGAPNPLDLATVYGEGKRIAEALCASFSRVYGIETVIARCFAFVGPYLPLNEHFAIGNFIRDILAEKTIQISGDGTPYRSYLNGSDLCVWLWGILLLGRSVYPYNVGSEESISIAELAHLISGLGPKPVAVEIAKKAIPGQPCQRYVPSTQRAQKELGLKQVFGLTQAVQKTIQWHQKLILSSSTTSGLFKV